MNRFAHELIVERRRENLDDVRQRPDLISMFLTAEASDGLPLNPSDDYLRDVIMNLYVTIGCIIFYCFDCF